MKTLHVLNGDGTAVKFEASFIEDQYIVWRECLFEGPVAATNEYEFWEHRKKYITVTYGADPAEYDRKVLEELHKIHYCSMYDALVLWFEFDLFCQINLLYLLSWLATRDCSQMKIYFIAIDAYPGIADFRGLGQLSPQQLETLLGHKQELTLADLVFAKECWQAYISADPLHLQRLLFQDFTAFPLLQTALLAHMERFPSTENGLNRIEQRILEMIQQGISTKEALCEEFCRTDSIYGLGDWQISSYIDQLQPEFISAKSGLKLTKLGKSLLKQEADVFDYKFVEQWVGGVLLSKQNKLYRWNKSKRHLEEDNRF